MPNISGVSQARWEEMRQLVLGGSCKDSLLSGLVSNLSLRHMFSGSMKPFYVALIMRLSFDLVSNKDRPYDSPLFYFRVGLCLEL